MPEDQLKTARENKTFRRYLGTLWPTQAQLPSNCRKAKLPRKIGSLRESPARLRDAAEYLERHERRLGALQVEAAHQKPNRSRRTN